MSFVAKSPLETRKRLLNAAEALILEYGFAGTTVEAVIERTGVTKGAFFHHFRSKADLGHAIIERYAANDTEAKEELMARAEHLSRDPLQQVLIFVGLMEEYMASLSKPYPGCLYASYCYQELLFEPRSHAVIKDALGYWRRRIGEKLEQAVTRNGAANIDTESLADLVSVVLEGSFILSKTMNEPQLVAKQLRHCRTYLEVALDNGKE